MDLPIGYRKFHKKKFFNYQMNRLHSLGFGRTEDIQKAAQTIKNREDFIRAFEQQAADARAAGRMKNAAAYLRAAEFFVEHKSQKKIDIYGQYRKTFYEAFANENMVQHEAPYNDSFLPAIELQPSVTPSKGTILLFGGFDSLIEEFFVIWKYFADAGYRVIAFEGPGQGGVFRLYGHTFDHDWEKPVGAILDHFKIEEAALIGISMGGHWALRAAAFESRIKQVVSWPPVYDWMEQIPGWAQSFVRWMLQAEGFMNATIRMRMRLFPILGHAIRQAMYMVQKDQPMDGVRLLLGMNKKHLNSGKVTQDVLLVGGEKDAFQPVKLLRKQEAALLNARSIKTRIFTKTENAHMHCQMGNLNLAMREIEKWLGEKI